MAGPPSAITNSVIPTGELRTAWAQEWPQILRWREMIKLDIKVDLPDSKLTGQPTPQLPAAARVLDVLDLW